MFPMPATTMQALVITDPGTLSVREVPRPFPREDQLLVRLEGCGVCGSNLPIWEGRPWFRYPLPPGSPGHEGWGRVVHVPRGVTTVKEGDRVAFLSERAFAEYDVTSAQRLVALPPALDDYDVPGEAMGCAMNIWKRADIRSGQTVAVVGVGFLGALVTQLAAHAGANVIAISRRSFALQLARHLGAMETILSDDDHDSVVGRVEELTGGAGCHCVIEAVGLQRPLDLATRLVRTRGRLLIAGYHQDGLRTVNMQLWNWRGIDVINAHERDPGVYVQGMRAAIDLVASNAVDLRPLLTHRLLMADASRAFELLRHRPDGFIKGVVTP